MNFDTTNDMYLAGYEEFRIIGEMQNTVAAAEENINGENETKHEAKIEWSPENLGEAAGYMAVGMLGVFMIIAIIMAASYGIGAIIGRISRNGNNDNSDNNDAK